MSKMVRDRAIVSYYLALIGSRIPAMIYQMVSFPVILNDP